MEECKTAPSKDDNIVEVDQSSKKRDEISTESVLFKIPAVAKKLPHKKDFKALPTERKKSDNQPLGDVSQPNASVLVPEKTADNGEIKEQRPLISFRPKPLGLPSEVYKPHRPTASEFFKHYSKLEKESKPQKSAETVTNDKPSTIQPAKQETTVTKTTSKASKLKYEKPEWSCPCGEDKANLYSLEVLKGGSIIDKINLTNKEYFVFGRLAQCDVTLEHPSISRYHAVLQFGRPTEDDDVEFQKDGSLGFYLYDLSSSHGTYLNKALVPPGKFYRVKVGHMMKFGGSSRIYILQGPTEDEETESKETATELRDKARETRKKAELAKMMMGDESDDSDDGNEESATSSSVRKNDDDAGITWGMLEEAVQESDDEEDKVDDKEEEIAFSLQDKKDPFYVKDPHKALKNFYEKEGMEVEFECTERRPGQWNVRLELPIDTPTGKAVVAEASITGKKRDAMNNCALEACRLLDKYGMFKQSEHHRRKVKQWEKEDFYDSDEDQYWDRTGELEQKRKQRKLRIGVKKKTAEDQPETYETLREKIEKLEKEVADIEKELEKDKIATRTKQDASDPLEEFMMQVKSGNTLDSITRSKLKLRLFAARKETARFVKLAEIARPASLPPLSSHTAKSMSFIGRMKGKKKGLLVPSKLPAPPPVTISSEDNNVVEEEEEDEVERKQQDEVVSSSGSVEPPSSSTKEATGDITTGDVTIDDVSTGGGTSVVVTTDERPTLPSEPSASQSHINNEQELQESLECRRPKVEVSTKTQISDVMPTPESNGDLNSNREIPEVTSKRKRTFGPTLPPDLKDRLMGNTDDTQEDDESDERKRKRRKPRKKAEKVVETKHGSCSSDPNYADWLPPEGQTGDGTTSLNAKFGY